MEPEETAERLRELADELDSEDEYPETIGAYETRIVYEDRWVDVHEDRGGDYRLVHEGRDECMMLTSDNEIHGAIRELVEE